MDAQTWIVIAIGALWLWLSFAKHAGKVKPEKARELVAGGAPLIDVRTPEEFAAGHLPDAKNVPLAELEQRVGELGDKAGTLVLYCRTGMRSGAAQRVLKRHGFTQVADLGAMKRWPGSSGAA